MSASTLIFDHRTGSAVHPTIQGVPLDVGESRTGHLCRSDRMEPALTLGERLYHDGYLFLPGFFDPDAARSAGLALATHCATDGWLDPDAPVEDLRARPGRTTSLLDDPVAQNPEMADLLYGRDTLDFFAALFDEQARSYDFTWARAATRGLGTAPHCDIVFMGRGSLRVTTMWTPWCDIPIELGGLALLKGSHRDHTSLRAYRGHDVDTFCENLGHEPRASLGSGGELPCTDANELRDRLGGSWLFTDYRAGDVLIFGLGTVHASLDNQTDRLRLSSDSRYQPAAEPIDERWVGVRPARHSLAAQRGRIC